MTKAQNSKTLGSKNYVLCVTRDIKQGLLKHLGTGLIIFWSKVICCTAKHDKIYFKWLIWTEMHPSCHLSICRLKFTDSKLIPTASLYGFIWNNDAATINIIQPHTVEYATTFYSLPSAHKLDQKKTWIMLSRFKNSRC